MDPKLERKHRALQQQWKQLLTRLEGLDDDQLNRQPQPDQWSVMQVLHHLIQVEIQVTAYILKKMRTEGELGETGLGTWFRTVLLKVALWGPFKFKAPPIAAQVPAFATMATIKAARAQADQDLQDMLAAIPPHLLGKEIFRHPYAGRLSPYQTLNFIRDHFSHHLKQVDRILAQNAAGSRKKLSSPNF